MSSVSSASFVDNIIHPVNRGFGQGVGAGVHWAPQGMIGIFDGVAIGGAGGGR
jgi:hypothetical protein